MSRAIVHFPVCNNNTSLKHFRYGLLGPSGCGKTMLLTCILDMKRLCRGEIRLGVQHRKEIGYMPQVMIYIYT